MPGNKKRRYQQYSLRLLLLLITAVALCLGWWVQRVETKRKAVEQLTKMGGLVQFQPWGPRWLQRTPLERHFQQVVSVELPGEEVHRIVDALRELRSIKKVTLKFAGVIRHSGDLDEAPSTPPELERFEAKAYELVQAALPRTRISTETVLLIEDVVETEVPLVAALSNGCVTRLMRADGKEKKKAPNALSPTP